MVTVGLKFSITPQEIDLDLGKVEQVTEIVTETEYENDHSKLANRELPDQHPMAAVTGLEEALQEMRDSVDGLADNVGTYDTAIEKIGDTVKNLEGEVSNATEAVGAIATKVIDLDNDVDELTDTVGDIDTEVDGLNESVGGLHESVGGIDSEVDALSASVEVLEKTVTEKVPTESLSNSDIATIWNSVMSS